jgi:hypothetical protein
MLAGVLFARRSGVPIEGRLTHKARYAVGSLGMTAPGDEVTVRWRGDVQHETLQLHLPAQDISGTEKFEKTDALAFNQWRVTEEHRPLGEIM